MELICTYNLSNLTPFDSPDINKTTHNLQTNYFSSYVNKLFIILWLF